MRYSTKLSSGAPGAAEPKSYKAPSPAYSKKGKGGKFKLVGPKSVPKGALKDLGKPSAKSNIRITGAFEATLTSPASCTASGDFASITVYDRARDIGFDIDIFREYRGTGFYSLRQTFAIAGLAIGNRMTTHDYETTWGQPDVEKGQAYLDAQTRGGVVSATMGPQPPPEEDDPSRFVFVDGTWSCR